MHRSSLVSTDIPSLLCRHTSSSVISLEEAIVSEMVKDYLSLMKLKVHYCVYNSPFQNAILSTKNPAYILMVYLFVVYFNIFYYLYIDFQSRLFP
jgi:hypothetical protein